MRIHEIVENEQQPPEPTRIETVLDVLYKLMHHKGNALKSKYRQLDLNYEVVAQQAKKLLAQKPREHAAWIAAEALRLEVEKAEAAREKTPRNPTSTTQIGPKTKDKKPNKSFVSKAFDKDSKNKSGVKSAWQRGADWAKWLYSN
jgi:CRISPR/Cas system-associated endonuclease Cas3-HD